MRIPESVRRTIAAHVGDEAYIVCAVLEDLPAPERLALMRTWAEGTGHVVVPDAWLREPDYVENASLEWVTDWVNRRPLTAAERPGEKE